MDYSDYQKSWETHAERKFENFEANLIQMRGFSVLEWKNRDGSNDYNIRFGFDEEYGRMTVDGDLGTAVFHFTEKATVFSIGKYCSLDYFMEKMVCSTDEWFYDSDAAKEELIETLAGDSLDSDEDEEGLDELIDEIMNIYNQHGHGLELTDELETRLAYYDADFWEWIYAAGRFPAGRIILWMSALRMARKQLEGGN